MLLMVRLSPISYHDDNLGSILNVCNVFCFWYLLNTIYIIVFYLFFTLSHNLYDERSSASYIIIFVTYIIQKSDQLKFGKYAIIFITDVIYYSG